MAYTGNHSSRLPIVSDYNQAFPNLPGQTFGIQARRPIQDFGAIAWVNPAGIETYNGLSARYEHRFADGLYFLNSFTWLKALANPQNIRDLAAERGPSSLDVEFVNTTSIVYDLPFGKGRAFGTAWNGAIDAVLGGWELTTIYTANSGLPVNMIYTPGATNDMTGRIPDYRGQAVMRPNLVGNSADLSGQPD